MAAGPIGTMMLGDLGADVIKIEQIKDGDVARHVGKTYIGKENAIFIAQNRNKRSIRLDLKKPSGRDAFLRMAKTADVITENFRPGTLDRLGVGYDEIKKINPNIIFASVSAFGPTGPYVHLPANDPIVQALSGIMAMTGDADGGPVRIGPPLPDFGAAVFLAMGVCAALLHRERTGQGQRLDLSLLSAAIWSTIPRDAETLRHGEAPERLGSGHPTFTPYGNYAGSDGALFFVSCFNEKFWQTLCDAIERQDLKTDPRTSTNIVRTKNRDFVNGELNAIFKKRTTAEWMKRFAECDVPAAPVQDLYQALRLDPQIAHNKTIIEQTHPTAGKVEVQALPVRFHGTPAQYRRAAPQFGEHSVEVLREFGFDQNQIDSLIKDKAVAGLEE
jgi:crotonobetainyl-CoA:carnitine CoA-transferase CaiB-like acyl-CoA transferase